VKNYIYLILPIILLRYDPLSASSAAGVIEHSLAIYCPELFQDRMPKCKQDKNIFQIKDINGDEKNGKDISNRTEDLGFRNSA
jgi:hypothetical protein